MNIKQTLLLLAAPLFLAACDRDRIPNICEDTPQFCVNLHEDSWCRFERTALIRARRQQVIAASEQNDYDLLLKLQTYYQCLDPLLAIEYTRRKERKTDKVDAVYHAHEAMAKLSAETQDSDYPYLLLWHWQHEGNKQARNRFLQLADRPEMLEPDLQSALAELLMLRDIAAAEQALHLALSLYEKGDTVDSHIVANLMTLYTRQQRFQEVWIWSRVLSKLDHKANIQLARMDAYAQFNEAQQQEMQQRAEQILKQLSQGQYPMPSL